MDNERGKRMIQIDIPMPKCCKDCPFLEKVTDERYYCPFVKELFNEEQVNNSRYYSLRYYLCPLIEVKGENE